MCYQWQPQPQQQRQRCQKYEELFFSLSNITWKWLTLALLNELLFYSTGMNSIEFMVFFYCFFFLELRVVYYSTNILIDMFLGLFEHLKGNIIMRTAKKRKDLIFLPFSLMSFNK